ncbi:uroporphyrinogen-III synthase, partial [Coemansia asiatica]
MFSKYSQTKVILFRDSSSDDDIRVKDKYTELLQTEHISVQSIPVLELQFLLTPETIDQLVKVQPKYSAIIFTSKNSVKALNRAATRWIEQPKGNIDDDRQMQERKDTWARFLELPVFVVGKATASVCRSLLYSSGSTAADIRGQDAGKAANVLPQITEFCRDYLIQNNTVPRLLFFCGNQRRDTLPDGILRQGGHKVELTEIVSYTTTGRSSDQVQASLVAALLDKSKLHNGGG